MAADADQGDVVLAEEGWVAVPRRTFLGGVALPDRFATVEKLCVLRPWSEPQDGMGIPLSLSVQGNGDQPRFAGIQRQTERVSDCLEFLPSGGAIPRESGSSGIKAFSGQ